MGDLGVEVTMSGYVDPSDLDMTWLPLTTMFPPEGLFLCVLIGAGFLGAGGTRAGGVGGGNGADGG